ncbi:MAG: hypothetical protein WCU80_00165 [Paludibacteraceae bacterium]
MIDKDFELMKSIFKDALDKVTEAGIRIISGRLSQTGNLISMELSLHKVEVTDDKR